MQRLIVVSSLIAAVVSVNPIEKTISLLKELQVKIGKDDDQEKAAYRKYKDFCDDATSEKIHEIEVLSAQKKRLTAEVAQLSANAEAASATIEETAQTLQKNAGHLGTAKSVRQDEASAFQAAEKELVTSIDMLGRAIDIVERESQKKHSGASALAQMTIGKGGLDGAVSALSAVVEAAGLNVRDMSQLSALLQSGQDEGDDNAEETLGAPKEAAYESKSRGILDLMGDLREKAETQLREAREAETGARHTYEMLRQALSDEGAAVDKEMKNARAAKSSSEQTKAEKEGDLTGTTRELGETKNTLEETQQSCMRHAADHEASLQGRAGELDALAKALNVIGATTGAAAARTYSFVQVASSASSQGKRIVDIVRRLAKKHKSRQLLQLASRVAAAVQLGSGKNAASPFTKVKGLISDMVARLEKEATEEADEKAYCDSEMQKSTARQDELKDQTTKLQTKIDQAVATSAKAMSQRKEIESELVGLLKVQEEMDQGRVVENQAYVEAKADMQEGLDGVRAAIRQLREYYTGSATAADGDAFLQEGSEDSLAQQMLQPLPPTGHSKSTGAGSSIIGLLEVIDADLAKALAELETEESGAQAEYEQTTQANKVTKATMDKDITYKTRKYKALEKSISDLGSDFSTADEELTAVEEYLGELEKRCIAKPEKYEDRKAKREAEIRGLQEALASIRGESASFLQRKRKSLRGH